MEKKVKMYFMGGEGIPNPVDVDGNPIKEGDILTHCWFEDDYQEFFRKHIPGGRTKEQVEQEVHKPKVIVKRHEKGYLYGEGLEPSGLTGSRAYMHDFRFKYAKKCSASVDRSGTPQPEARSTSVERARTPK